MGHYHPTAQYNQVGALLVVVLVVLVVLVHYWDRSLIPALISSDKEGTC
jgi:hypothetical protein